jgi:hypothetical protein
MKKAFLLSIFILFCFHARSQEKTIDPRAVIILDRMSEVIGELNSCSFKVKTSVDRIDHEKGLIKQFFNHDVFMVGPDKMHVQTNGANGKKGYWYNGDLLMYYSLSTNQYGFIETPDNILETIDLVHEEYDIEFPAADFFYPSFSDDLMESNDRVDYLGLVTIDGVDCHHIVASNPDTNIQIWVSNDTFVLPLRYTIHEKKEGYTLQFEGIFSEWKINPILPDAIFDFVVPENATRLSILSKSATYKESDL